MRLVPLAAQPLALEEAAPEVEPGGAVIGEIVCSPLLDAEEVPPVVHIADDHLAEGIALFRSAQDDAEGHAEIRKGHGGAAAQHGLPHQRVAPIGIDGELVAQPGIFRAVEAAREDAAGVGVSPAGGLFQNVQTFLPAPRGEIIINTAESGLHFIAEKLSHRSFSFLRRAARRDRKLPAGKQWNGEAETDVSFGALKTMIYYI